MTTDHPDRPDHWRDNPRQRKAEADTPRRSAGAPRRSRLWLWFVLAFVLQLGAWVAWFMIANQHRVETVPLVTNEASSR